MPQYSFCHSLLNPSSIQSNDLPGQIGVLISQVVDQIGDLLCLPKASGGNLFDQGDEFVLLQETVHLRIDGAARNRVYLDVAGSQFLGQRLGEGVDSALCR